MPSDAEIKAKFWKALKSDRTLMIGLNGVEDGHARPMTAQFENDRSPIWFFASTAVCTSEPCSPKKRPQVSSASG